MSAKITARAFELKDGRLLLVTDKWQMHLERSEEQGCWLANGKGHYHTIPGPDAPAKPQEPRRKTTTSAKKKSKVDRKVLWRVLPKPKPVHVADLTKDETQRVHDALLREGNFGETYGGEPLPTWPLKDDDYLSASQVIAIVGWDERKEPHSMIRTWRLRKLLKPKRRGKLFIFRVSQVLGFMRWFQKYEEMRQRGVTVT